MFYFAGNQGNEPQSVALKHSLLEDKLIVMVQLMTLSTKSPALDVRTSWSLQHCSSLKLHVALWIIWPFQTMMRRLWCHEF